MGQVWIVWGTVSTEPVTRSTGTGKSVTSFRIADGKINHDVTVWEMKDVPSQGDFLSVQGRAFYDSYEVEGQKRYVTKLSANASGVTIDTDEAPAPPKDSLGF